MKEKILLGIYYRIARNLPENLSPLHRIASKIRGSLCSHIFKNSGNNILIKKRCLFWI